MRIKALIPLMCLKTEALVIDPIAESQNTLWLYIHGEYEVIGKFEIIAPLAENRFSVYEFGNKQVVVVQNDLEYGFDSIIYLSQDIITEALALGMITPDDGESFLILKEAELDKFLWVITELHLILD